MWRVSEVGSSRQLAVGSRPFARWVLEVRHSGFSAGLEEGGDWGSRAAFWAPLS